MRYYYLKNNKEKTFKNKYLLQKHYKKKIKIKMIKKIFKIEQEKIMENLK